jgi:hypothetical protein
MKSKVILILILAALAFPWLCSVNTWDINRYQNKFEAHKGDFEALVSLLKLQSFKPGYPINQNELPQNIQRILDNLNISDLNTNASSCKDTPTYEFTTSWSSKATLYFSKDFCNNSQTIKGYHEKVSETIEFWGMGDEWTMWIDYDFI